MIGSTKTITAKSGSSRKEIQKKNVRSLSMNNKKLENTLSKMDNISLAPANNSVLTQRKTANSQKKKSTANAQFEQTVRMRHCCKQLTKNEPNIKTDRKESYFKFKTKQIKESMLTKNTVNKKNTKKRVQSAVISAIRNPLQQVRSNEKYVESFDRILIRGELQKTSNNFKSLTDKTVSMDPNSRSFMLTQMEKVQNSLKQRIHLLEKQKIAQNQNFKLEFKVVQQKNDQKVIIYREQIRYLSLKVEQQNNANMKLQKQVNENQRQMVTLKEKLELKNNQYALFQKQMKMLQDENKNISQYLKKYESQIHGLHENVSKLQASKSTLEEQLKISQKEKMYIKQNSIQVLRILREQFGDQLKNFIK